MTQPAPQQQTQAQQNQQLAIEAAAALATAGTVVAALGTLGPAFAGMGIRRAALRAALRVVIERPPAQEGFYGAATAQTARLNLIRRAQFLVASSRRFNEVMARVAAGGADPREIFELMRAERRYYGQHQEANWTRMRAAAQVDTAVMDHGLLLGWHSVNDRRTSPECRAANRHNFRADDMPLIGFPGAVHPHCRCWPGAPFPGAPMVGETFGPRLPTRLTRRAARRVARTYG